MMKKHFLIESFENQIGDIALSAIGTLSNDGSAITYSINRLSNHSVNLLSFSDKIKKNYDADIKSDEFGMRFSKDIGKYFVHFEIDFFDDSFSVNLFSTGSIYDQKEDIETLAIYLIEEMSKICSFSK